MQQEDTVIDIVRTWLEKDENPTKSQRHLENPATWALWLFRKFLHTKNGALYYEWIDKVHRRVCLVVPTCLTVLTFFMIQSLQDIWSSGRHTTGLSSPFTGIMYHNIVQSILKGVLPEIKIRSLISNLELPLCLIMQDLL